MALEKNSTKSVPTYQIDPWVLTEEDFSEVPPEVAETLFSQGNGYLGTRGTLEEPVAADVVSQEGTYLNGVFVREEIHYDENAYGFATHNNKMIMVPDAKRVQVLADGEVFQQATSSILEHSRSLDMRDGMLRRIVKWKTKSGGILRIDTRRFVSAVSPNLFLQEYILTSENYDGPIELRSGIDTAYGTVEVENDPRAGALSIEACLEHPEISVVGKTTSVLQGIKGATDVVSTCCWQFVESVSHFKEAIIEDAGFYGKSFNLSLKPNGALRLVKLVHYSDGKRENAKQLQSTALEQLRGTSLDGFDKHLEKHRKIFAHFWDSADTQIVGDAVAQQAMRFNMFHLFQAAGRDGKRAIGAKGLTGPGYDGHYFWDTEIYVVPFFIFNQPEIARSLLMYRVKTLDAARKRARVMSHAKGALYPWRTIGGEECSSFFPAGTAQYHINAAIAYAVVQYFEATLDVDFMEQGGAELLFETARIWMELGHYSPQHDGGFSIHEVTGPDEYSAMVDNNLYTNVMAQYHMESAADIAALLAMNSPGAFAEIAAKIGLADEEIEGWKNTAAAMYVPYDESLCIHEQHEGFMSKPEWNFSETRQDQYPLLLNFHPLVIYRHQVLKQADVVLAQILLSDRFSKEDKARNLMYYEPRTTHDSTLSACIYSIANSESGDKEQAFDLFEETCRMDLENGHKNTQYGVHIACMAGSWMAMAYGFAGMRFAGGLLSFEPYLPNGWHEFTFNIQIFGQTLGVQVCQETTTYRAGSGSGLTIKHNGLEVALTPFKPVTLQGAF